MASDENKTAWAPLAIVERYHTQDNAWREEHMRLHREVDKQIADLTGTAGLIKQRLESGVETFTRQANELKELRATDEKLESMIKWPAWKVITTAAVVIMSTVSLIATVVWFAARVPTRAETDGLKDQMNQMKIDQATMRQSLNDIDQKLDQALKRP